MLSLKWLGSLLWYTFEPRPRNFYMPGAGGRRLMTLGLSIFVPKWRLHGLPSPLHTLLWPHWISHQSTYTAHFPTSSLVLPGSPPLPALPGQPQAESNSSLGSCAILGTCYCETWHFEPQFLSGTKTPGNVLGFLKFIFFFTEIHMTCSIRSVSVVLHRDSTSAYIMKWSPQLV